MTLDGRQFPDRDTVPSHHEALAGVERAHDLTAVVA